MTANGFFAAVAWAAAAAVTVAYLKGHHRRQLRRDRQALLRDIEQWARRQPTDDEIHQWSTNGGRTV